MVTALAFSATAATNPAGLTWLGVTPNTGNTPNNLQVTINPANLGVGVYNGSIIVSSSALNVPTLTIPVTLTVVGSIAMAAPTNAHVYPGRRRHGARQPIRSDCRRSQLERQSVQFQLC